MHLYPARLGVCLGVSLQMTFIESAVLCCFQGFSRFPSPPSLPNILKNRSFPSQGGRIRVCGLQRRVQKRRVDGEEKWLSIRAYPEISLECALPAVAAVPRALCDASANFGAARAHGGGGVVCVFAV